MQPEIFQQTISGAQELEEILGLPGEMAVRKQIDHLDAHCRRFIGLSPLMFLSTANRAGWCDVSPKGDAPGFVRVLSDTTLAIPDRPGNRRADTLRNILENPQIGLIFVVPGMRETLRINGQACIFRDPDVLASMAYQGKTPQLAIGVTAQEVYLHCGKALIRSHLWQPETWPAQDELPNGAEIFTNHIRLPNITPETAEKILDADYMKGLY
jgi:uncharacterized protein